MRDKQKLIRQVVDLTNTMVEVGEPTSTLPPLSNERVEMFTIKEYAQWINGLPE